MSSKISFRKVLGEDLRQRIWLIVFFSVLGFLTYSVILHFSLQNVIRTEAYMRPDEGSKIYLNATASMILSTSNVWTYFFVTLGAVLASVTGLNYLHSKEKSDFFQSLGIKRQKLFVQRWLGGMMIFLIPYIANVLICIFVFLPLNGAFDPIAVGIAFRALGIFVLGFTALYSTCVLACVLTGRVIVSLIVMAMIFVYVPVCRITLFSMISLTYDKLYMPAFYNAGELFSPLGALIRGGLSFWREDNLFSTFDVISPVIALSVWAAATFTLGLIVHRYRPTEAAGRAMCFAVIKPIVKIAFGILMGLAVGTLATQLIYYENGDRNSGAWFWFWSILTVVLVQIILEAIYNKDMKSVVLRWKSFLIMLGGLIAVAVIILSDPLKANVWFPEREDVAAMSVSDMGYSSTRFIEGYEPLYGVADDYFGSFNGSDTGMNGQFIEDFEYLYSMLRDYKDETNQGLYRSDESILVGFRLNDGTERYRMYGIGYEELENALEKMSGSEEFRKRYYPAFNFDFTGLNSLTIYTDPDGDVVSYEKYGLTDDQLNELIEAYKKDSAAVSIKDIDKETDAIIIDLSDTDDMVVSEHNAELFIYPQFTNTLECLSRMTGESL